MNSPELLFAVAVAANLIFVWLLSTRHIVSLPRPVLLTLTLVNSVVVAMHLATQMMPNTTVWWFFNVNFEQNLISSYSALLLLSTGILALFVALGRFAASNRLLAMVWLLWGVVYLFLCYDESYTFHEFFKHWKFYFSGLGGVMVLAALYGLWADVKNRTLYLLMMFGLGITAGGGLLLDDRVSDSFLIEELLELAGTTLVLAATYTTLRRTADSYWMRARKVLFIASPIWLIVLFLVGFWPLPMLEARLLAQPVQVDYLDGALSLVAYQTEDRTYRPGDWVKVSLYWQANRPLDDNYAQSIRLLRPPYGEVAAQTDMLLGPPNQPTTNVWPEGFIFKKTLYIKSTDMLTAPVSYWLSLNVWRAPWDDEQEDNMLLVSRTDKDLLLPDTAVLERISFTSTEQLPPAPLAADYQFDKPIRLTGYDLPAIVVPGQITLRFWWQTDAPVNDDLVQFLHLQHTETGHYEVIDHPPLLETFPTSGWPDNFHAIGEWTAQEIGDLPAGQYDVYTGLYDQNSQQRIPARNGNNEYVPDHRIHLGQMTVTAR
ncbi:MAG: hypothetical protein CL610_01495 [Anaerolineaceae bacterium]|nr:hypothetical protein [Anaerolineaceae bacterium]